MEHSFLGGMWGSTCALTPKTVQIQSLLRQSREVPTSSLSPMARVNSEVIIERRSNGNINFRLTWRASDAFCSGSSSWIDSCGRAMRKTFWNLNAVLNPRPELVLTLGKLLQFYVRAPISYVFLYYSPRISERKGPKRASANNNDTSSGLATLIANQIKYVEHWSEAMEAFERLVQEVDPSEHGDRYVPNEALLASVPFSVDVSISTCSVIFSCSLTDMAAVVML